MRRSASINVGNSNRRGKLNLWSFYRGGKQVEVNKNRRDSTRTDLLSFTSLSRLSCFMIPFDGCQQYKSEKATHVYPVIISYSTIVSRQKKSYKGARPSRGKNCCTKWTSNCENLQSCEAVKTRYAKSATKTHEAKILSNFNLLLLFLLFLLFAAKFFSYVLQTI